MKPRIDTGGNQGRNNDHTPMEEQLVFAVAVMCWLVMLLGVVALVHVVAG